MLDQEAAKRDPPQASLAVRDRVEDGRVRITSGFDFRSQGWRIDYILNGGCQSLGERDFNEDDRLVRQRRMEEAKRSTVRRQPASQVGPTTDLMDGLVLDQALKDVCWSFLCELFKTKKAAIEPGTEQVFQVFLDRLKLGNIATMSEQDSTHVE